MRDLTLIDLTGAGAYEAGVDTDANRARAHGAGQILSEAVHREMPDVDGILFNSRLTAGDCIGVYDCALSALSGTPPIALLQAALLPAELIRLGVTLRRARGFATA